MNNRRIVILIILIVFPILSVEATEVRQIRYYSDTNKTRITVELDDKVQYQTQFDSEKNIIIYLLNTKMGSANKLTRINDTLVRTVTLMENEDNVCIKTALIKSATFTVFSLNSPFRIVIDIIPVEKFSASGPINVESVNKKISEESKKPEQNIMTQVNKQKIVSMEKQNVNQPQFQTKEVDTKPSSQVETEQAMSWLDSFYSKLENKNVIVIQIALDLILIVGISIVSISFMQYKRTHEGQKAEKLVKKKQIFADVISELENKQTSQVDENIEIGNPNIKKTNNLEKNKGNISIPKEYEKVYELFQRGMDRISISQKSNIPIGEVNLILDLIKSRKESNVA